MKWAAFLLMLAGCANVGDMHRAGEPLTPDDVASAKCIVIEHVYSCAPLRSGHNLRCIFEENATGTGERIDNFPGSTTRTTYEFSQESFRDLRKILASKKTRKLVGDLQGDELTRAPKGFDPAHPAVDLIKKKDWLLDITLDSALATTPKLYSELLDRFRAMAPLIDYLNRPLVGRKPPREVLDGHF